MKYFKFLLFCFLLIGTISFAQQKKYINYTVEKGETMKSIAKAYKMSTRDLMKLNPGIGRKPKVSTVIIVPNLNYGKEIIKDKIEERSYLVKPKETEFGIAGMHGITIDELRKANPELKDGLKIGMKLVIPKASITQLKDSVNFVLHRIVKDDTPFNLSKKYEITQEELLKLNPVLEEGFKIGTLLKIKPINPEEEEIVEINELEENLDFEREIKVVFMLPFQLNKMSDSIILESFARSRSMLSIATDFQMGANYAIDSLRRRGLTIKVNYFDTEYSRFDLENNKYKLQYITNRHNFNDVDIVIGPLNFENAHMVSKRINAPVIAPLFSRNQIDVSSGNLIKSSPDDQVYEERVLEYMEETYNGETVIVINDEAAESQSRLWRVVNKIKSFDSIQEVSVIKPTDGFIDTEIFKQKLDSMGSNWVLDISQQKISTSAAINNLKGYAERIDIDLFTFKKGRNYDDIDNEFLGKLNFLFGSSEYLDPENEKVDQFFRKYKAINYAFPSNYAIRGFDVTYDVLIRLANRNVFDSKLKGGKSTRVASVFDFNKKLFSGFENKAVLLIQYHPDLSATLIDE